MLDRRPSARTGDTNTTVLSSRKIVGCPACVGTSLLGCLGPFATDTTLFASLGLCSPLATDCTVGGPLGRLGPSRLSRPFAPSPGLACPWAPFPLTREPCGAWGWRLGGPATHPGGCGVAHAGWYAPPTLAPAPKTWAGARTSGRWPGWGGDVPTRVSPHTRRPCRGSRR